MLKQSDIDKIKKVSGIKSVTPYYSFDTKYATIPGKDKYLASLETNDPNIKLEFAAGSAEAINEKRLLCQMNIAMLLVIKMLQISLGKHYKLQ